MLLQCPLVGSILIQPPHSLVVSQFVIPVPHKARDKLQRESKHCFFDLKMDAHCSPPRALARGGHDMILFKLRHCLVLIRLASFLIIYYRDSTRGRYGAQNIHFSF